MGNIIQVNNLSKRFGETKAVDSISFEVKKGELFGFLGVNGAGKSTTINMLCTLMKKTSGNAKVCGFNIGDDNEHIRKKIGVVFQNNSLDDLLTVKENLISRTYLYENNSKIIKKNLNNVCEILQIGNLLNKQFKDLSGGQKRNCDIARALMHTPEILFLDEPTTGLDPKTRKNLWNSIEYLQKESNMTVFLTTHYMEEAAKANNISIMDSGKIVAQGTPFELKGEYAGDLLKVETLDNISMEKIIRASKLDCERDSNRLIIKIKNSIDSIDLLNEIKPYIKSFEVVQGTMEDAFLNITGKSLKED